MPVSRKTEVGPIDGTPVKRMFWSIISDYDLKTGLCELVDNALDLWTLRNRASALVINISLNVDQQFISIEDNAGGIAHEELRLLVTPGGSRNDPNDELIGIFGVGGKRASIALGEHVEIRTRSENQQSYQIDITKGWLGSDDWDMPVYEIPDIDLGTTIVEISQLRKPFSRADVEEIRGHLSETYARFIRQGCTIKLEGIAVSAQEFDHWAYPRGFAPRRAKFKVSFDSQDVSVEMISGLIIDRDPEKENYGVYIYCNDRLIVKELRTRDVGYFVTAEAGVPHPDASMCRVVVTFQGPAVLMPWNSSKSGISMGHTVFQHIRPTLIQLVSYFSSLSRRLKHEWDEKVTPLKTGAIEDIPAVDIRAGKRISLPELPRVNKRHVENLKSDNKKTLRDAPWTVGLVEAIAAVDVITRQRLDTKNRIALVLLDSNFEISLKEFIVHRQDLFPQSQYPDAKIAQLFKNRSDVIKEVAAKIRIRPTLLAKASHYYNLRNKLIHERATVDIPATDIENYKATIQSLLKVLFKLKFN